MRIVATLLIAGALAAPAALAAGTPQVRLAGNDPAVVRGSGFDARELVTVTVRGGSTRLTARVTTTATGTFTARWAQAAPAATGCRATITVTAVGARGDRAGWKSPHHLCTPIQPIDQ